MKKFISTTLLISLCLFANSTVLAQSQFAGIISQMEKSVLGLKYENQTDSQRLERLENAIYGKTLTGEISNRIKKLSTDVNGDLMGHEITPKRDTFETEDDYIKEDLPKEDKSVDYPSVNSLEDKIFNKEFKGLDVNQRLSNLEKNVFKKTYSDSLNERVERLQTAIKPNLRQQNDDDYTTDSYSYYGADSNNYNKSSNNDSDNTTDFNSDFPMQTPNNLIQPSPKFFNRNYSSNNLDDNYSNSQDDTTQEAPKNVKLASIEKSVLQRSYANDTLYNRISRLESAMFGTIFDNDDVQTRLERISSAYKAQKSASKYDSNKLSKHIGTAMQIGAILLMVLAFVF